MSIASNKYASKVFSEHPVAIWPMDDDVRFLSLVSESEKNISDWNLQNCSINSSPSLPNAKSPFLGSSNYYEIVGDHTILNSSGGTIEIKSDPVFSFNSLNQDLDNFSINFYLYQDSQYTISYEFGFKYFDTETSSYQEVLSYAESLPFSSWIRLSDTFNISEFDADTCEIILRINVDSGGLTNEYNFIVHGFSVGQWSELFSSITTGSDTISIPASTGLTGVQAISCEQYGPLSENAYYLVENQKILARTDGVPLTFGSENSVRLYASSTSNPSFIFPGKGFLSESGRNKTQTVEFWMRIKPNTKTPTKIWGPLNSNNGIYVNEGFITLSIGGNHQSHNVYEWYRPMLIHVLYNETNCQMYINGEQVVEVETDRQSLIFEEYSEWIGFFLNDDIEVFEIDCISIMPYSMPLQVARRRFVWGQGVESQQIIDDSFKGSATSAAMPTAGYSINAVYPDKESWNSGYYTNFSITGSSLSVPNYQLPEIFLNGRNISLWYQANKIVNDIEYPLGDHPNFITFRPGTNSELTEWIRDTPDWNEKAYLQFSAANVSTSQISAMFAVFEIEDDISEDRPLIHIVNALSGKRFEININGYELSYNFDGTELYSADISGQEHIVCGFHIPTIIDSFGSEIANFFSSYDSLQIYVGGSPDTFAKNYETFEGKIYRVSFSDASNYNEISIHFSENGIANYDDDSLFLSHYATYTVSPFNRYGDFFLDISIFASWEEYYPLSIFSDYAIDADGSSFYGLDFLQFNIGHPAYFNSENSSVKIYATFQLISEGANQTLDSFTYTKNIDSSLTIDANEENTEIDPYKAYKTKFEIVDGTIIYPPKNIRQEDLALTVYIVANQDCIISNPLTIRDMSVSSKTLNSFIPNEVSTKFSKNIYPYTKRGVYLDYKTKNPFLIYNKSNPYLYLTNKNGIKVLSYSQENGEHLVAIPVNESLQAQSLVAAVQLFIKPEMYDAVFPLPVFEIQHKDSTIEFIANEDSSGKRIVISCRDKFSKQKYENIVFYVNGTEVDDMYLEKQYWYCIGLVFPESLDYTSFTGSINIFAGSNFDNISYYSPQGLNEISLLIPRTWQTVLTDDGILNFNWGYWYNRNGTSDIDQWKNVYTLAQDKFFALTPEDIYDVYIGTNISVIDDGEGINIFNDDFYIYSGILWSSNVGKPA